MKLKQYLLNEESDLEKEFYIFIEKIKKNCKPYFHDVFTKYNKKLLMSGRRDSADIFFKKKIRQDRRPMDMPLEIHKLLDDWFQKKFGVRARSQSIFCSFRASVSNVYGSNYFVFPIGEYKILSSGEIYDLVDFVDDIRFSFDNITNVNLKAFIKTEPKEKVDKFIELLQQKLEKTDYSYKISNYNSEMMVICKEVYLLKSEKIYKIMDKKFVDVPSFIIKTLLDKDS